MLYITPVEIMKKIKILSLLHGFGCVVCSL